MGFCIPFNTSCIPITESLNGNTNAIDMGNTIRCNPIQNALYSKYNHFVCHYKLATGPNGLDYKLGHYCLSLMGYRLQSVITVLQPVDLTSPNRLEYNPW